MGQKARNHSTAQRQRAVRRAPEAKDKSFATAIQRLEAREQGVLQGLAHLIEAKRPRGSGLRLAGLGLRC